MNSHFSIIYEAISERLSGNLTKAESRYIDLDLGQMENYDPGKKNDRPPLSFPAQLVDFESTNFQEEGEHRQKAETTILIRLCFEQISPTDRLTPQQWREKGLAYLETEWKINKLLHGWTIGDGYGYMIRLSSVTENRPDHYRVRQLRYRLTFTDNSTLLPLQTTPSDIELEGDLKIPGEG